MRRRDFLSGLAFIYGTVGSCCLSAFGLVELFGQGDSEQYEVIENESDINHDVEWNEEDNIEDIESIYATMTDITESLESLIEVEAEAEAEVESESDIKTVYLTFDDGPSYLTADVLDILDEYNVKATFFVIYQPNYEEMYSEIVKRGHAIGVHSYSHVYSEIYASFPAWKEDFEKLYTYIYEETGVCPSVYRFPGGSMGTPAMNHPDVTNAAIDYLETLGIQYFDWNVSGVDGGYASTYEIYTSVVDEITERNHPVILMHDGVEKENSLAALPDVLKQLTEWGYSFETLDADAPPIHQGSTWDY